MFHHGDPRVLYVIEQTRHWRRVSGSPWWQGKLYVLPDLHFRYPGRDQSGRGRSCPYPHDGCSPVLALGYDRIVGAGIVQLGVCIGFTTGAFNIFTTGICQELAGISIFSAWGFRLIEFLVCFVVLSSS